MPGRCLPGPPAQAAGTAGAPTQVLGRAVPRSVPLRVGCAAGTGVSHTCNGCRGSVPTGPCRAVPQACLASPVPGYRQLSRQHTPTHHKHLVPAARVPSPAHLPVGLAPGRGCGATPQRLVGPRAPFPTALSGPTAPGGGEGVLGVAQGAGVGLGAGSGERAWGWWRRQGRGVWVTQAAAGQLGHVLGNSDSTRTSRDVSKVGGVGKGPWPLWWQVQAHSWKSGVCPPSSCSPGSGQTGTAARPGQWAMGEREAQAVWPG